MRLDSNLWSRPPLARFFFILISLSAWTTTASLFVVLKLAPLTRAALATRYYAALCCLRFCSD
jgi:hypothetical protein